MSLRHDEPQAPLPSAVVLNRSSKGAAVVHETGCPAIEHQVSESLKDQQPMGSLNWLAAPENQQRTVADVEASRPLESSHYSAEYVAPDALPELGLRYVRCRSCSPAVPDCPVPISVPWQSISCKSLNHTHLGRLFDGIGTLQEIRVTHDGYTLIGDDDTSPNNAASSTFYYLK